MACKPPLLTWPWRLLKALLRNLAALLILFEEWGWAPLARLLGLLARLPVIGWLERRISVLPPVLALLVFFIPALLLLPIKIIAFWLMAHSKKLAGIMTLVGAKIVGTAVVARLFMLTKPQLMRLAWFARGYERWAVWKESLLAQLRSSWAWRIARVLKRRVHAFLRRG